MQQGTTPRSFPISHEYSLTIKFRTLWRVMILTSCRDMALKKITFYVPHQEPTFHDSHQIHKFQSHQYPTLCLFSTFSSLLRFFIYHSSTIFFISRYFFVPFVSPHTFYSQVIIYVLPELISSYMFLSHKTNSISI